MTSDVELGEIKIAAASEPDAAPSPEIKTTIQARQLAWLQELGEIGMDIARDYGRQAGANAPTENPAATEDTAKLKSTQPKIYNFDIGLAFERVARSVRRIIALEQEVAGLVEDHKIRLLRRDRSERKDAVCRGVRTAVGDAIREAQPDIERRELRERVENLFGDYNDYDDDDHRRGTVGETIARICRDLGVETDPSWWDETGLSMPHEPFPPRAVTDDDDDDDFGDADESDGDDDPPDGDLLNGALPSPHLKRRSRAPHARTPRSRRNANSHDPP